MGKTFKQEHQFSYPWHETANAVWNKYPNPHADHVVSVDVLSQSLDPISGSLRTERIIGVRQGAPGWLKRIVGASEDTYVREVVMVNPLTQSFEMSSTNLSLSDFMLVKEYITYLPSSRTDTMFRQTAQINCTDFFSGLLAAAGRKVEDWSYNRFNDNAAKGREGLQSVLDSLYRASDNT
ncbi:Protein UPS2, mitochondrial [Pseudozyma hubeiensis]|nr:Protein UPS2, mitochondrial [Pseudozyma hubeiensis]